jgi:hypothetical protein
MAFPARFPGRCNSSSCRYEDAAISIGDDVDYHQDVLMHTECAARERRNEPPLCRRCWEYHRGECV